MVDMRESGLEKGAGVDISYDALILCGISVMNVEMVLGGGVGYDGVVAGAENLYSNFGSVGTFMFGHCCL